MFNNFLPKNCAVYEIMWKNILRDGHATDDYIIWRMRVACCIPKDTDTHTEYVILIALPRYRWLCERASVLRCTTLPVLYVSQNKQQRFYYTVLTGWFL